MLLVTTTMGMVHGVHCHTSHVGPSSSLCLELVMLVTGFADRFIDSATSSNNSNHGSAVTRDGSSASTGQSDSGLATVISVSDDDC